MSLFQFMLQLIAMLILSGVLTVSGMLAVSHVRNWWVAR